MNDSSFTYDLFLSHSSKDKAVVRPIAERLRADGLSVWFDEWEIRPGENIPAKIEEGLDRSRVLVLCMSANAFGSDWAQLESGTFRFRDPLNRERRFLPLRLDASTIPGSLASFQYIGWWSGDREAAYADLLTACRPMEGPASAKEIPGEPPGTVASSAADKAGEPFAGPPAAVAMGPGRTSDADPYPAEIRGMLKEAEKYENAGDVWSAERCLLDAAAMLRALGQEYAHQVAGLLARAQVNHTLAEQLRSGYRGVPGTTLVRVFDESNQFQYSAPKVEVHNSGLLHHTVILLVRNGAGKILYYRRHREQTAAGKWDFFGGHTADVDNCPMDTARREANEELQLSIKERRLHIPDEWIHQIGDEGRFAWHAPYNRERSTLFVVELPNHPALKVRITDEAADGLRVVTVGKYETAFFGDLVREYRSGTMEFADGAERVLIEYGRDAELKKEIDAWFATPDMSTGT